MTSLGLLPVRRYPTLAAADIDQAAAESEADEAETTFLRDVADYPDGGVAERYKRLGLSVRAGERIKRTLAKAGLIHEEVQTNARGKLRVIRLTEQARLKVEPDGQTAPEDV